jgi:hypothetical protein
LPSDEVDNFTKVIYGVWLDNNARLLASLESKEGGTYRDYVFVGKRRGIHRKVGRNEQALQNKKRQVCPVREVWAGLRSRNDAII